MRPLKYKKTRRTHIMNVKAIGRFLAVPMVFVTLAAGSAFAAPCRVVAKTDSPARVQTRTIYVNKSEHPAKQMCVNKRTRYVRRHGHIVKAKKVTCVIRKKY
jgi:hypothetical protein